LFIRFLSEHSRIKGLKEIEDIADIDYSIQGRNVEMQGGIDENRV